MHSTYNARDLTDKRVPDRFCCREHYVQFIDERYEALMQDRKRWLNA